MVGMRRYASFLEKAGLLLLSLSVFGVVGLYFRGSGDAAYATLNYQDPVTLKFTLNSTIDLTLDSTGYVIGNLAPGTSANSNVVTARVKTNSSSGYTLWATLGSSSNASTSLRRNGTDTANYFACASSLSADKWVFSTSLNNSTWTNRDCLPVYTQAAGVVRTTNTPVTQDAGDPTYTRVSAQASATKAQGTYTNVINFSVTAN